VGLRRTLVNFLSLPLLQVFSSLPDLPSPHSVRLQVIFEYRPSKRPAQTVLPFFSFLPGFPSLPSRLPLYTMNSLAPDKAVPGDVLSSPLIFVSLSPAVPLCRLLFFKMFSPTWGQAAQAGRCRRAVIPDDFVWVFFIFSCFEVVLSHQSPPVVRYFREGRGSIKFPPLTVIEVSFFLLAASSHQLILFSFTLAFLCFLCCVALSSLD